MTFSGFLKKAHKLGIVSLGIVITCLLIQPIAELMAMVPKNYNEGWNAFHGLHAMGLGPLYPHADQLFTNNYPPLSFYLVGSLGQLMGDGIFAGRLVALVSLLIVAISIVLILRFPLHCSVASSLFSGLLFLGYMGTHYRNYIGMNDPQMLGHAMQMSAGLLLWVVHSQFSNKFVSRRLTQLLLSWCALGIILSSLFVKHNLLPFPATLALWLVCTARGIWLWLALGMGGGGLLLCIWGYGTDFINGVFFASRQYQLARIPDKLLNYWLYPAFLWIICGVAFGLRHWSNLHAKLLLAYFVISLIFAAAITGGQGVGYNAVFDVLISLVLLLGWGLDRMKPNRAARFIIQLVGQRSVWIVLLALPIIVALPFVGLTNERQLFDVEKVATAQAVQAISMADGPVMCEMLALCYWANQPLEVDFFNTGQKMKTGAMDEAKLISLIEKRHFAIIQLDRMQGSQRLPANVNQTIFKYYQVRPPMPPLDIKHPAFLFYRMQSGDG